MQSMRVMGNTIKEVWLGGNKPDRDNSGYAGNRSKVRLLSAVNLAQPERISSGLGSSCLQTGLEAIASRVKRSNWSLGTRK